MLAIEVTAYGNLIRPVSHDAALTRLEAFRGIDLHRLQLLGKFVIAKCEYARNRAALDRLQVRAAMSRSE